jgi:CRISPR type III-B/RAMP module RAMP protein Cmr6
MIAATKWVQTALSKRCDTWHLQLDKLSLDQEGGPEARTNALRAVCSTYDKHRESLGTVVLDRLQFLKSLKHQHGDRYGQVTLALDTRLILHLGRASVLQNAGLYCDRTTGLPFIPGTALKGVVSTWAAWSAHFNSEDGSFREFTDESVRRRNFSDSEALLAQHILGDDWMNGSEHAGDIVFVGGFPESPPVLGLDIVNPHHEPNGKAATRLTPTTFLCLEPDTQWHFVYLVRPGASEPTKLLATTHKWIEEALTQLGIGAKTAAGYGRFRHLDARDIAEMKKQADQAKASAAAAVETARLAADKEKVQTAARAVMAADYPSPTAFKNSVLDKLNPGQLMHLEAQVSLLKQAHNAHWLEQLKATLASRDYKDLRKRLREKEWFPKDWLPPQ